MSNGSIFEALEPVVNIFEALGIRYQIGGSIASSAYGIARATLDVDLVANLEESQIGCFVDGLQDQYYVDENRVRDAVSRQSSFNLIHLVSMLKIDVFILKTDSYDQTAFARARLEKLEESASARQHYLTSPEDIILKKLDWYRQGGCISERQWNDAVGVLQVQRSSLDMKYLRYWAAKLGLTSLLSRALSAAGMEGTASPEEDA